MGVNAQTALSLGCRNDVREIEEEEEEALSSLWKNVVVMDVCPLRFHLRTTLRKIEPRNQETGRSNDC